MEDQFSISWGLMNIYIGTVTATTEQSTAKYSMFSLLCYFITDEFPYKIWSHDCVIVQGAGSACIFDVQGACGYICQICTYTPGQFMGVCTCEGW